MKLYIMVFNNTHEAMAAEKLMDTENIKVMVMPTPTYITKSCGISLKFDDDSVIAIDKLIEDGKIKFKNVYFRDVEGFKLYK
ncbi:DUF3343 domain-containing protein [uncultured Clostridium sp.]|uniref:DUF3343 domain-containing protein n=1 Tax=uncultured Clostridium sp. TaxID=59620 RepID=UPI00261D2331|nr:DUF3343 domain-containing protein [uncultured Clostridium sp.]